MKLHYRKLGAGKPLFILHGLFGSSDNWQTLGKKYAENYEVYLIDQRNHGHSDWSDEFNYQLLADDLIELIAELGFDKIMLLGHSMGGKTAMLAAQLRPDLIEKLIVVDIGPKDYPMHHDVILTGLKSINTDLITSRKEAENCLSEYIQDAGVQQFLLKNLYWKEPGKLAWRINIPALEAAMPEILRNAITEISLIPTLFLRGEKSNYILESDFQKIYDLFPNSEIETVYNAGHWVHAENPLEFYRFTSDFLE